MGARQLSSDRDFTAFLESVDPEQVIWEGMATATRLQQLLWQTKAAERRTEQEEDAA